MLLGSKPLWLFTLLVILLPLHSPAQENFESLDSLLKSCPPDSMGPLLNRQARHTCSPTQFFRHLLRRSDWHRRSGRADSALGYAIQAEKLARNDTERGKAIRKKAQLWMALQHFKLSGELLDRAYDLTQDSLERVAILHSQHKVHLRLGDVEGSLEKLRMALALLPENQQKNKATTLHSIGRNYSEQGRYDSAAHYMSMALESYQALEESYHIARTYSDIGTIYMRMERINDAQNVFSSAKSFHEQLGLSDALVATEINLAAAIQANGELMAARNVLHTAEKHAIELNREDLVGICLLNKGELMAALEIPDSAIYFTQQALSHSYEIKDFVGQAEASLNLARLNAEARNRGSALPLLRDAAAFARQAGAKDILLSALKDLAEHHRRLGSLDSAFFYLNVQQSLEDSIQSKQVQTQLAEIEGRHRRKIAQLKNYQLQMELHNKAQELNLERQRTWLFGAFLTLILLSGAWITSILITRNKRQQRKLGEAKRQIQLQEEERAAANQRLAHLTNLIKDKNRVIQNFEQYANSEEAKDGLLKGLATDRDWAQFMVEFQALFPKYFQGLNQLPVKLSKNDFRIAALMKLQLSNKEMAKILHISLSGVKAAKSRFRSKIKDLD